MTKSQRNLLRLPGLIIRVLLVLLYWGGEWVGKKIEWLLDNVFKGLEITTTARRKMYYREEYVPGRKAVYDERQKADAAERLKKVAAQVKAKKKAKKESAA